MRVGVIMGGDSHERDISLLTGKEIIRNLDSNKYEIVPICINKQSDAVDKIKNIDFAVIALHGKFGEDGSIQAILESLNIQYTGSGILSSALCMDKDMSKRIFLAEDINTPKWININKENYANFNLLKDLNYPLIVKPNNGGSSIGTFIVNEPIELENIIHKALSYDSDIMIEEYIDGEEITCCVLNGEVLPIISIKANSIFFDYNSKYSKDGAIEKVAILEEEVRKKIEAIAIKCWKVFKLKSYGRIDMIIKNDEIYVLEINTLPGMTKTSLFPKSAAAMGIDFMSLLDKIIEYSIIKE
ncbi:D-alanine--D-alanine ligase [Clostridium sp.]|uniref:D-alanine--D-alanine ligase n=1 Tax=Clostridium sp. TaxID=1506 RepID=UPI002FC88432